MGARARARRTDGKSGAFPSRRSGDSNRGRRAPPAKARSRSRLGSDGGLEVRGVIAPLDRPSRCVPAKLAHRGVIDGRDLAKACPRKAEHIEQRRTDHATMSHDGNRFVRVAIAESLEGADDTSRKGIERLATASRQILTGGDPPPFLGESITDLVATEGRPPSAPGLRPSRNDEDRA